MLRLLIRRILYAIPILLGVSAIIFSLVHLAPGDIADLLIPPEASKEVADALRARFGLDRPVLEQYFVWLGNLLQGDLGVSLFTNRPVAQDLVSALGNTLLLAIPAALLGFGLGIALGTLAAFQQGKWLDKLFSGIAIAGVSLPHYWVGIVLVTIFAVIFNVLPAQGMGPSGAGLSWASISHYVLPTITLSLIPMGVVSRVTRSTVLDILGQDFIDTLEVKGLRSRRILFHIMKNAAPTILAIMGLQFGYLLGGSILVETVFNWPGSGNLINLAIFRRDIPVLSATILVLAAIFVVLNIIVDVMQAMIDPRLRRK